MSPCSKVAPRPKRKITKLRWALPGSDGLTHPITNADFEMRVQQFELCDRPAHWSKATGRAVRYALLTVAQESNHGQTFTPCSFPPPRLTLQQRRSTWESADCLILRIYSIIQQCPVLASHSTPRDSYHILYCLQAPPLS